MKHLWLETVIGKPGTNIADAISEAITVAASEGRVIKLEGNGVVVNVAGDSDLELLFRDQQRAQGGYIDRNVGPYPTPDLTDEEKANDAKIEAENEKKREQWRQRLSVE